MKKIFTVTKAIIIYRSAEMEEGFRTVRVILVQIILLLLLMIAYFMNWIQSIFYQAVKNGMAKNLQIPRVIHWQEIFL